MKFDWDDDKRRRVEAERGLTLPDVAGVFADPDRIDWQDMRRDYGEERRKTIGAVSGRCITVVYTMRDEVHHIITAWPSSRQERKFYGDL